MVRAAAEGLRREVGERLSVLRDVLGITQRDLAERVGIRPCVYNMIERGLEPLRAEDAQKISEVTKVTVDWIYSGKAAGLAPDMAKAIDGMQRAREIARQVMADFAPRRKPADVIQFNGKD